MICMLAAPDCHLDVLSCDRQTHGVKFVGSFSHGSMHVRWSAIYSTAGDELSEVQQVKVEAFSLVAVYGDVAWSIEMDDKIRKMTTPWLTNALATKVGQLTACMLETPIADVPAESSDH